MAIWRRALSEAVERSCVFHRVEVVASTDSTMELARGVDAGTFIVALEQTSGRGRRGRTWFDGGGGVAATAVLEMASEDPLLSTRAGLAMAAAVEPWLDRRAGLKWPNDLVIAERKVGGALIERSGSRVHVGIGINVDRMAWPAELANIAASLAEVAPMATTRLDVACSLLSAVDRCMRAPEPATREAWGARDWLRGRLVRIRDREIEHLGRIVVIEPDRHLDLMDAEERLVRVPAATAEIVEVMSLGHRLGVGDPDRR